MTAWVHVAAAQGKLQSQRIQLKVFVSISGYLAKMRLDKYVIHSCRTQWLLWKHVTLASFSLSLNNWTEREEGLGRVHIEFFFFFFLTDFPPTSVPTGCLTHTHIHTHMYIKIHARNRSDDNAAVLKTRPLWAPDKIKRDEDARRYNVVRLRWVRARLHSSFSASTTRRPGAPTGKIWHLKKRKRKKY